MSAFLPIVGAIVKLFLVDIEDLGYLIVVMAVAPIPFSPSYGKTL